MTSFLGSIGGITTNSMKSCPVRVRILLHQVQIRSTKYFWVCFTTDHFVEGRGNCLV